MNVIIADDHELVVEALATLIGRDQPGSSVFRAKNFEEAFNRAKREKALDIVLLDVYMPGMEIVSGLRKFHSIDPELPVVLMSGTVNRRDVDLGFENGAMGFIPKTMNGKALVSVLSMVSAGSRYVPEIVLENDDPLGSDQMNISPRERDVLRELVQGLSNKVIARNLNIEESTVKLHLRSLFRKLNVKNRTEAVIIARELGICDRT